jgi:hypothetical protein
LVIVPDADHVDLNDRAHKIAFNKIADFFNSNLRVADHEQGRGPEAAQVTSDQVATHFSDGESQ